MVSCNLIFCWTNAFEIKPSDLNFSDPFSLSFRRLRRRWKLSELENKILPLSGKSGSKTLVFPIEQKQLMNLALRSQNVTSQKINQWFSLTNFISKVFFISEISTFLFFHFTSQRKTSLLFFVRSRINKIWKSTKLEFVKRVSFVNKEKIWVFVKCASFLHSNY